MHTFLSMRAIEISLRRIPAAPFTGVYIATIRFIEIRTYAVEPFCVTATRFACGSMVLYDHMFVVFALGERKNDKREKRNYRSTEGSARQLRKSY